MFINFSGFIASYWSKTSEKLVVAIIIDLLPCYEDFLIIHIEKGFKYGVVK